MTKQEKGQIELLRTSGYSYGEIARMLNKQKSTVSNYCLRNHIESPGQKLKNYRLCPVCKNLFIAERRQDKSFCSNTCRSKYWREIYKERELEQEKLANELALQKELDLFREKSDEWISVRETILCIRNKQIINQEKEE